MRISEFIRKIKDKKIGKAIICLLLIAVSMSNIVLAMPTKAVTDYSKALGTNKALGSPLVESTFTTDDWNKWEMLTFGVFLSNFCTPFVDSYKTAFSSGSGGSEGSGRNALVFAAGGDVNSEGILNTMLGYCITTQSNVANMQPIQVKYTYYIGNKPMENIGAGIAPRAATLDDLLVVARRNASKTDTEGKRPYVVSNLDQPGFAELKLKNAGGKSSDYYFEYIVAAGLPTLFVDTQDGDITVFDASDGWDIQVMSAFLSTIVNNSATQKELLGILENAARYPLYFDAFGNICIVKDNQLKVVLPAASNQHITIDGRYNLLNSLILNGNYIKEDAHTIAAGLEATDQKNFVSPDGWDIISAIRGGNSATDGDSEDIKEGQVVIYEDTDTTIAQYIYNNVNILDNMDLFEDFILGKFNNDTIEWSDIDYSGALLNIAKNTQELGKINAPLKLEVVGGINEGLFATFDGMLSGDMDIDGENIINRMASAAALLSNAFPMDTDHEVLNWMYNSISDSSNSSAGKTALFKDQIFVAASIPKSKNIQGGENANEGIKSYTNFFFNYLLKNDAISYSGLNVPSSSSILDDFKQIKSPRDLAGLIFNGTTAFLEEESAGSHLLQYYLITDTHYGLEKGKTVEGLRNLPLQDYDDYLLNVSMWGKAQFNYECNMLDSTRRIIKVYKKNASLSLAADYLSMQAGTEFSAYATWIYLTYLDFYGILDGQETHKFNESLFKKVGFSDLTAETVLGSGAISEEDQKKQILNRTYLLLSPEGGRDYRNQLITSWFEDWMHEEYQNICYGNASTSAVSSSISTRMSEGFLQIDTFEDNFLTSWFIENYAKIVGILMGIFIVLVIIAGIIKGERLSWFVVSLGVIILVCVLAPSSGEATPYICNKMIQSMFSENMTYWAMSESIENTSVESQHSSGSAEDTEVLALIDMLQMLYLDKTIMIKKDISKKVVEKISVDYGEIQRLQSTRWMLPTLIQQISADDGSADYVYTTLTDLYGDMSSMYWMYAREDVAEYPTSHYTAPDEEYKNVDTATKIGSLWEGYTSTESMGVGASGTTKSVSRAYDPLDPNFNLEEFHTTFYMLDKKGVLKSSGSSSEKFKIVDPLKVTGETVYSKDMWNLFGKAVADGQVTVTGLTSTEYSTKFRDMTKQIIKDASTYNSFTTAVRQSFGYLWTTETPAHYFYQVIKDTFDENAKAPTLASVIQELQGEYVVNANGEEKRRTFMHYKDTGYTRDILDLEELFTNVIPYMYTVQVLAGGENGENGILGTELMEDYSIYEKNMQSWLYRSNWVTKLVEYPLYSESCTITGKDASGNDVKYEIASPLYPQNYPADQGRPMIFSEAQMHELGLNETDLSIVELKLIKINKDVEKDWTLLINYSNAKGITKEVFYRQMAVSALLAFNNRMSPDNWVSSSRALYPTTLDLRNISFDAVMKMIMLSDTANSAYMSRDTMYAVIADGDTFSGFILLATAWLASYLVPFLRNIVLGLMFYLGFVSMIVNLFRDTKKAAKSAGGLVGSNILFMVATIAYYAIYYLMITTSTVDSVLSVKNISMSTSVPTWKFLLIFGASIIYLVVILRFLNFLWKNYRDMGFEIYHGIMSNAANKLSNAFESVGNRLSGNLDDLRGSGVNPALYDKGENETKIKNTSADPVKVQTVDSDVHINNLPREDAALVNSAGDSGYNYSSSISGYEATIAEDIDRKIEEGKGK